MGANGMTLFGIVTVCALLWHRVTPSTIADQAQSQYAKDATNAINGQSFNEEGHHAEKVNENQNSLSENKNTQYVGAKDSGHFSNQDINKKIFDDNKLFVGQNFNHDSGERAQGVSLKKGHKKGHHSSGFSNSYHKDESSNNSSYFDDYSDEADRSNYQKGQGRYGNEAEKRFDTRKQDGVRHVYDNARQGNYDRSGGKDSKNVDNRDFDRKHYQSDQRDVHQLKRGQTYGGRDREFTRADVAPQYHGRPYYDRPSYPPRVYPDHRRGFYGDRPPPVAPPQSDFRRHDSPDLHHSTITIFEDPRIHDPYNGPGVLQDNSEFVRLDVRPGSQRFQRYDSYYEPRNWGVNRRSDINPLVFNYNRY